MKSLIPHPKDLHVLGISEKDFVRRGIRTMLFAILLALCMFALVTYSMGATPILLILFLLLFPVAVWIHMVRGIEVKATARRSDMDIAVAVFLDLVNVLLVYLIKDYVRDVYTANAIVLVFVAALGFILNRSFVYANH